jgi:predicted transcriptional regulator
MNRFRNEGSFTLIDLPVRLTAGELKALRDALPEDDTSPQVGPSTAEMSSIDQRAREHAHQLLAFRRRRDRELGSDLFADPAWDILLDLFVHHVDGKETTVSNACYGACVPAATALRYIASLVSAGFISRRASDTDRRVVYIDLTEEALTRLRNLFIH